MTPPSVQSDAAEQVRVTPPSVQDDADGKTLPIPFVLVAATHKETKQFFTLYNTLDDKKVYLEKEVSERSSSRSELSSDTC